MLESLINYIPQILVLSYIVINLWVGLTSKVNHSESEYFFAGRKLSLPALVMTLVATWYGGILAIGEHTYNHGIVTWIIFSLFYYMAAAAYAIFIAPRIAQNPFGSIPELIENTFGKASAIVSAIIIVFFASPAPYLIILSTILSHVFDIPFYVGVILGALVSMLYIIHGGFRSVIRTDIIQFSLMYIGFFIVLIFLISKYGGYSFLQKELGDTHLLTFPGNLKWSYVFVWGFIAFVTFIDPNFYQRSFAGRSAKLVKKGIFYSIALWFIFDIISITTALYAAALISNSEPSPYLALSQELKSPILEGVFLVSMIAVVMSTIDSFSFVSGFTIGKNILTKIFNKSNHISYSKTGIVITALISIILATIFKNAISFWYVTGSFAVSSIMIPMLCCIYNKKIRKPLLFICIPLCITGICFILSLTNKFELFQTIDPMYPGILASYICYVNLKY